MSQVLTVSCKLEVSQQQVEKLNAVLTAFAKCCEYVNTHTPEKLTNQIAVQSLIYKEARSHSGLSAQMTIHIMSGRLTMIKLLPPATNRNESNH